MKTVMDTRLYNPPILLGDILVSGTRVAKFTSAIGSKFAESSFSPLCVMFDRLGLTYTQFERTSTDLGSNSIPIGRKMASERRLGASIYAIEASKQKDFVV